MTDYLYVYHRIDTAPRQWQAVADRLASDGAAHITAAGGKLYGLWRSQIGRPRDEIQAITVWPGTTRASEAERLLLQGETDVWTLEGTHWVIVHQHMSVPLSTSDESK